jgi:hypothetical protein
LVPCKGCRRRMDRHSDPRVRADRHRFPFVARSIASSSGAGFDSISETAARVCPGWQ